MPRLSSAPGQGGGAGGRRCAPRTVAPSGVHLVPRLSTAPRGGGGPPLAGAPVLAAPRPTPARPAPPPPPPQVRIVKERASGKIMAMKKLKKAEMLRRGQVGLRFCLDLRLCLKSMQVRRSYVGYVTMAMTGAPATLIPEILFNQRNAHPDSRNCRRTPTRH